MKPDAVKPKRVLSSAGAHVWTCGRCHAVISARARVVCVVCGREIKWPPKRKARKLAPAAQAERDYAHAVAMVAKAERRIKLAVTIFDKWRKREAAAMKRREIAIVAREAALSKASPGKTRMIELED